MRMAEYLLINLNNSFTKVALADTKKCGSIRRTPTSTLSRETLLATLRGWRYDKILLASVVPTGSEIVRAFFVGAQNRIVDIHDCADLGCTLDYPEPRTLGADRIANAVSLALRHRLPAISVDFGTATTFEVVTADRRFIGGMIAPGLNAMTDYLHQRTALLPKVAVEEPPMVIARNTQDAILAGAVFGYRGLITGILSQMRKEPGLENAYVVATGGDAEFLAPKIPAIDVIDPLLTMEGLREIALRNLRG